LEGIPNAYGAFGFQGLCLSLKKNSDKNVFLKEKIRKLDVNLGQPYKHSNR
jgi:hypothetical protein